MKTFTKNATKTATKICYFFLALLFALGQQVLAQAATVGGEVYELLPGGEATGLPFAAVILWQNGEMVAGKTTDYNGRYRFEELAAGDYVLQISQLDRQSFEKNISLRGGQAIYYKTELPIAAGEIHNVVVSDVTTDWTAARSPKEKKQKSKFRQFVANAQSSAPAVVGTVALVGAYYGKTKAIEGDEKAR